MANENNNVIEILFGVEGGSDVGGASGKLIKETLDKLAEGIRFKLNIDEEHFAKQLENIKKKIDAEGLSVLQLGASNHSSEYERAMRLIETLREKSRQVYSVLNEGSHVYGKYKEQLTLIEDEFDKLYNNINENDLVNEEEREAIDREHEAVSELKRGIEELTQAKREDKQVSMDDGYSKLYAKAVEGVGGRYAGLIKSNAEARTSYDKLLEAAENYRQAINSGNYQEAVTMQKAFKNALSQTSAELSELQIKSDTLGKKLVDNIKGRVTQLASYAVAGLLTRALNQIYSNVVKIDTAMTSLKIVTNATKKEMDDFADSVADTAKKIGSGISELTDSVTVFARLGYSLEEASVLAEKATIYSNVSGLTVDEATTNITAIIKAFDVDANGLGDILDQLIYVGNNYAISSAEIGQGMNNAASSLAANGNTLQQAIGILTAANVTVQNADKSSTAVRTIAARMAGSTTELTELGEETDNVLSSSKLDEKMRAYGVAVLDGTGNLRSTYDVLADIAKIWDKLETTDRSAIAEMLSGTRQQNVFYSIMQNWQDAESVVENAASGYGSLTKAQENYLDSIEGRLQQLEATWQDASRALLDSDFVKIGITALTSLAKVLDWLASNVVGVAEIVSGVLITMGLTGFLKLVGKLLKLIIGYVGDLSASVKTLFSKNFTSNLKAIRNELKNTQKELKINAQEMDKLSKETGYSVSQLESFYQESTKSADATSYYTNATRLSAEQQEKLNALSEEKSSLLVREAAQTKNLEDQLHSLNMVTGFALGTFTLVISILSRFETKGTKIAMVVVSVAAIIVGAIGLVKKAAVEGIKTIKAALNSNGILAIISMIISAVVALVEAIVWLCKGYERAKEEAQENSKALQEEADALREVSDAAKEAADSIAEIVDEIKSLSKEMSNTDWHNYLDSIGSEVANLYSDEALSSLEAINKLLGTAYTYDELRLLSASDRLALLDEINKAAAQETKNLREAAYEEQKKASTATVQADGMKERIETDSHDTIEEFINDIYAGNEKGITLSSTAGKKFKVQIDSENAKDYVDKVQKIVTAYEQKYGENSSALEDNAIYQYFVTALNTGKQALATQVDSLYDYLEASAIATGMNIPVDLDAEDLNAEYDNLMASISKQLKEDPTISGALAEGLIQEDVIAEYATNYIATYYKELYNAIGKGSEAFYVASKSFSEILDEAQEPLDTLSSALKDIEAQGILSADSISKILESYPELERFFKMTPDGYVLADAYEGWTTEDILRDYVNSYLQTYVDELAKCEEGTENYTIAQENLNTAIAGCATLLRSAVLEERQEALEEEKDALEDQLDEYKSLIDLRKELLETYKEELDYQKELSKKQSTVADLKTQLALAQMDTSASGRARARELQEELASAEEELDDFTLERAISELTADLDDTYTEHERLIKSEVDRIVKEIEDLKSSLHIELNVLDEASTGGSGQSYQTPSHHDGGFVGGRALLKSNEEFAKLLNGELVVTPAQMSNFMSKTLPAIDSSGKNVTIEYNSPLIEIKCGKIDESTLPELDSIVDKAVNKIKKDMKDALGRTGYRKTI